MGGTTVQVDGDDDEDLDVDHEGIFSVMFTLPGHT